ncbi:DeoR/GlpR family DNA-binding transcription regulator [Cohnella cellulosilytica]|uniref:DeoR/GlpR family DNA-binding transcription regulator n=1 Tax=Cohnella cellulosilytica TaxID=986710 RepID=A0ABW2FA01_9BACL
MKGNYYSLNARQQQMLEQISREGEVRVTALRETYGVTEMTIRRDLEKLEETGEVKRTFGGVIFVGRDVALQERVTLLSDEKARIGRYAAALIKPGESVFIDGGTTTSQIARFLPHGMNITVVTNALNVVTELSGKQIPVMMTGGVYMEATHCLSGPLAVQSLSGMAFHRAFLGTTGVTADHGFSNSNIYEAEIKQLAIRQATETTVVADRSKFGTKMLISFAPLSGVQRIVTDSLPDETLALACRESGVLLEVAE